MKLSKMEQRLLNVMGSDYVSSTALMDRLYEGLRRPKTVTIPSIISRLRAKGVKIETLRGKGYRLGHPWFLKTKSGGMILTSPAESATMIEEWSEAFKLKPSFTQGGGISSEIRGMMARYGINFSVVADIAMKAIRAIATPVPSYLLTAPPKYGAIDYVRGPDGTYRR
jgi:biotin operon repressor